MSDERQDDEILGGALGRAIETIEVNETPYERSRFATTPSRRLLGPWQLGSGVAAVILALAFGLWLTWPNGTQEPAAGSLKPAPTTTASPQVATPVSSAAPDRDTSGCISPATRCHRLAHTSAASSQTARERCGSGPA